MFIRREDLINCSWCRTVRRRDTNEPIAEPLQTQLKREIESHGMCSGCSADVRRDALAGMNPQPRT